MNIKNVVIVGGGSSGWFTASALSKLCKHINVTLIESPNVPTIGVGESTIAHINRFFKMLGIEDKEFMPACNATYKNSIRFTNFREKDGTSFEYPFNWDIDVANKPSGINAWAELTMFYPDEFKPHTFAELYCTGNALLSKHNKQTFNREKVLRNFNFEWDTAYNLDATALGQWMKNNIAVPNGTNHIVGHVEKPTYNEDGHITSLTLTDGTVVEGDLFVDCTGFKSLLLEEWMGSKFISFEKYLANDAAITCRLPYLDRDAEMRNVTDCHALDNGWVWDTPLWNRIGTGYVYSSKFTTREEAEKEFRAHLATRGAKRAEEAEFGHVNIRHGYRENAWVKNVVGVGLSYGFVEPLESTGLLTTHENIVKLVETLNRRKGYICRTEIDAFNVGAENDVIKWRDFVSMHYAFSMREDTPYWKWCTQETSYVPSRDYMMYHDSYPMLLGFMINARRYPHNASSLAFIAAGLGLRNASTPELMVYNYFSQSIPVDSKLAEIQYTKKEFDRYKMQVEEYIETLPSNYEFLKEHIYGGVDEYK